ncbi:MAG: sigma-70 family RNA polymerase sigma factor [Planctomycetaceae bacterium]|nr:sigma-70 family RNA polymerase sigma factor [Planctomycetaceae bacterium]
MTATDDELMIRLQSGESSAFDEIVARYEGALVGFFMRNTRDVQFSEDLAQETLLKVYSQVWDYVPLGRFRGWMFRIGRNLLVDNIRRRSHDALIRAVRRQPAEEQQELARVAAELLSPHDQVQGLELANLVDELLLELPEEQRQTFTLHHFAELSLPEVAEIMAVPLPTCKSRLRLAREKLSEKLLCRGISGIVAPG